MPKINKPRPGAEVMATVASVPGKRRLYIGLTHGEKKRAKLIIDDMNMAMELGFNLMCQALCTDVEHAALSGVPVTELLGRGLDTYDCADEILDEVREQIGDRLMALSGEIEEMLEVVRAEHSDRDEEDSEPDEQSYDEDYAPDEDGDAEP